MKKAILLVVLVGISIMMIAQPITAEEEPVVLQMLTAMWLPGEIENTNRIVDKWNETRDDIKIELTQISWPEYRSRMATSVANNDIPDLIFNSEFLAFEWAGRGIFADINELATEEQIAQYHPNAIEGGSNVKGELLLIPTQWEANGMMHYNKEMFADAGIEAPILEGWTYEEEKAALKKLTTGDTYGMTFRYQQDSKVREKTLTDLWQQGDKFLYFDEGEQGWRVDVGDGTLWAFNILKEYVYELEVVPEGIMATTTDSQLSGFLDEKFAIVREGPWLGRMIEDSKPEFEYGIMHPTRSKERATPPMQVAGYSISKSSEHKEEALEFLLYFTTGENGARYAYDCNLVPPTLEHFEDPKFQGDKYAPILSAADNARPMPDATASTTILDTILPEVAHWSLNEEISSEDAVKTLRQEMINALKTYGDW